MEVRPQALVQTAGLRRLVLAHGFASVEHRRGTPALGGRATAGTGELRQVVEGRLSVHRHCGDMEKRRVRAEEVEREIFPRKLLNQRPGFCCNRQRVIINSGRFFSFLFCCNVAAYASAPAGRSAFAAAAPFFERSGRNLRSAFFGFRMLTTSSCQGGRLMLVPRGACG